MKEKIMAGFTGKKKETYEDGSSYEGNFVNDEFHGKGKFTWYEDDIMVIYEGDFVKGVFQGKGKKTWTDNGDYYEGDFVDGAQHGKGKITYANGDIFIGDFVDGERVKGKLEDKHGWIKEGDFVNGKLHGKGKETFKDGTCYEGIFEEGELKKGKVTGGKYKDLIREGEFIKRNGLFYKLNGQGKKTDLELKQVEEGIFEDDELFDGTVKDNNGKVIMKYKNGNAV
jgi:hypothetical protein